MTRGDPLQLDVNTAYACLAGTAKHVCVSASDPNNVRAIADMCATVAGSWARFVEAPFLTIMVCHVVPPMRFAEEACGTIEQAVRLGFPVQIISAGQAGATSPATIAGSLVQAVAETLAGLTFAWLVDPRARAVFAPKPLVADLRTGAMCGGGGEQAVLMAAAAQMGRYYDLPTSSIAGITDAKVPDAQHGYEKCLAVSQAAHAGANIITQACGMQASLLGASLEGYVVDNDMLGAILRTVRGVEAGAEDTFRRRDCGGVARRRTLSRSSADLGADGARLRLPLGGRPAAARRLGGVGRRGNESPRPSPRARDPGRALPAPHRRFVRRGASRCLRHSHSARSDALWHTSVIAEDENRRRNNELV